MLRCLAKIRARSFLTPIDLLHASIPSTWRNYQSLCKIKWMKTSWTKTSKRQQVTYHIGIKYLMPHLDQTWVLSAICTKITYLWKIIYMRSKYTWVDGYGNRASGNYVTEKESYVHRHQFNSMCIHCERVYQTLTSTDAVTLRSWVINYKHSITRHKDRV